MFPRPHKVVIVAETRKLGEGAHQTELSLLRQENARLTRKLSDLQQNYSSSQKTGDADDASVDVIKDKVEHDDQRVLANECLQSAMRLLEDSIHVYDNFVKKEIRKAERELCNPECRAGYYENDWTYEYGTAETCEVDEHVKKTIVRPFAKRANELRDSADGMLSALVKSLRNQFGVSMDSRQSSIS